VEKTRRKSGSGKGIEPFLPEIKSQAQQASVEYGGDKVKIPRSRMMMCLLMVMIFSLPACWKALIVGGSIRQMVLMDGVYVGKDSHGPNKVVVRVTIRDNRIAKIDVLQNWGMMAGKALPTIPDRIVKEQSTKVDAVTGATNTSHVIMNAVHKAVLKAVRKIH
jgi:uncharacterized protein with FMN-binding domain